MNSQESGDRDLKGYLSQLRQYWVPVSSIFVLTFVLACFSTLFLKPAYRAEGKMRFKVDRTSVLEGVEQDERTLTPLVATQNPLSTEIEVIYSKPLLKKVIDEVGLVNREGKILNPKDLSQQLEVSIVGGTDVLKIAHESDNPEESAEIVNTLMRLYLRNSVISRRSEANEARKFIANQLPQSEKNVRQAETAISEFKERNKIVNLDAEAEAAVAEISRLDSAINQTRVSLDEAVVRSFALKNQVGLSPQDAIAVSNLSQSSEVQEILRELQSVERQMATAQEIYQDSYPEVLSLKAKQEALSSLLKQSQQELQNQSDVSTVQVEVGDPQQSPIQTFLTSEVDRQALAKRLESLLQRRASYSQRVKILPQLRQNLRELERKLKAAQSTYESLLVNLQELKVAENSNANNAEVIEPALIPTEGTTFEKKVMIVAFGILLGAFLATASVPVLAWRRQHLLKSKAKSEPQLDYPVWAVLPSLNEQKMNGDRDPNSLMPIVKEMRRMIQSHPDQLLNPDCSLKTLMVSSPAPHEGRSTIAANLASAMAQLGKQVLLIDADIQNSNQHKIFELPSQLGLSDIMSDSQIRFDEIKMVTNRVMENLDVLPSGTQSTDLICRLDSEQMEILMQYFALNYDFIIVDTPPFLQSSSAPILGQLADGVLLVVHSTAMNIDDSQAVEDAIVTHKLNVVGQVISGCQTDHLLTPTRPAQTNALRVPNNKKQ